MSENKLLITALVIVGVALVGSLVYVFRSSKEPPSAATQTVAIPKPAPKPAPAPQPAPQPKPQVAKTQTKAKSTGLVLPRLDDSDQLIRDGVVSLTRNEGINSWLGANHLIRRCVAFVDNAAHGNVVRSEVPFLAPDKPFKARRISDNEYVLDPASYARYDTVTKIFTSINSKRAAQFYALVRPLFQKAYADLGYPNKNFDKVIFEAIGRLLETPVITKPIKLVRPSVMYKFASPKLQSLSALQKQLIRMGPKNTKAIQAKLSEMAVDLRSALKE